MINNLEKNKEKRNNLTFELNTIEELIKTDKIVSFLKLKKLEIENINFFEELQETLKSDEVQINELENFKNTIGELTSKFYLSSRALLLENKDLVACPLCDKGKFDSDKALLDLEKRLKIDATPQMIRIEKNLNELNENKTIIEEKIKIIKELFNKKLNLYKKKLENELDEVNNFFINLKKEEEKYIVVKNSLNKLYIKYDDFINLVKTNSDFLLKNMEKEKIEYEKELNELLEIIDFEKVNEYNELLGSSITKEILENNIKTQLHEKEKYENIFQNIISLKEYFRDNSNFKELKTYENQLFNDNKNKKILEIAKDDFEKLCSGIDTYIYNAIENKSKNYEEVISRFYKYLNPHENFNSLKIKLKKNDSQNNNFRFEIYNDNMKGKVVSPAYIFSSAQNNVLAIAIFLSFALDSKWSKLETIFLDDPIQNMDDINIYAFTDLIKKISEKSKYFYQLTMTGLWNS